MTSIISPDPFLPPPAEGYQILRQVLPVNTAFTGVQPALAGVAVAPLIITDDLVKTNDASPVDPRINTVPFKLKRQVMGWDLGKIDVGGLFRLGNRRSTMRLARVVGRVTAAVTWSLDLKSPQWDGSIITTNIASSTTTADNPFLLINPEPTLQIRPDEYLVFTCTAGADVSWIELHIDAAID